jgi:hypothetical protein
MSKLLSQFDLRCADEYKEHDIAVMLMDHEKDDSRLLSECGSFFAILLQLKAGREIEESRVEDCDGGGYGIVDQGPSFDVSDSWADAVDTISNVQAKTVAGLQAKLRVIEEYLAVIDCGERGRSLIDSFCQDVQRLVGDKRSGGARGCRE